MLFSLITKQVFLQIAAHAGEKQIFVMGHSMGGIMSREIVAELKIWGYEIPFVMLFDSWVLRTNELDIENIKQFITVSTLINLNLISVISIAVCLLRPSRQ